MQKIIAFLERNKFVILASVILIAAVAAIEFLSGRSPLGPDGKFGWWDGNIWGSENSQRLTDAYSLTHILHGILFYGALRLALPKLPARYRLIIAVALESAWELLENSPIIINRYRAATISLGYFGDSILNSCSDIVMMALGFTFASRVKARTAVIAVVLVELLLLLWVRDNLSLNIIMLIHPINAVKLWQAAGH